MPKAGNGVMRPQTQSAEVAFQRPEPPCGHSVRAGLASDQDFYLAGFDGEGQTAFSTNFYAEGDRFFDVLQGFGLGLALADAAGNGGTLGDPDSVLVTVQCYRKLHIRCLTDTGPVGKHARDCGSGRALRLPTAKSLLLFASPCKTPRVRATDAI